MRRPSSLLFWMIVIAVLAALAQGLRELGAWRDGAPPRTAWGRTHPGGLPSGQTLGGRARAVDGDSLEMSGGSIRLFGIDAPERYQTCRDGGGRDYPCGRAAARALNAAIAGRVVSCAAVDHDRYDRDVARCSAEGHDLSEMMVRTGHALELAQFSRGRYAGGRSARRASCSRSSRGPPRRRRTPWRGSPPRSPGFAFPPWTLGTWMAGPSPATAPDAHG